VKFTGTTASTVTTAGDTLNNVEFDKTGANVILADAMTVNGNVTFGIAGANRVDLGSNNINLAATSTITGANATHYFIATGTGRVVKSMTTPSPYTFPVGDATIYSPLAFTTTGGSGAGSVSVGVVNAVHPNKPAAATSFLTRYWRLTSTYPATLTGTFNTGDDVTGTASLIRGAIFQTSAWTYLGGSNGTNTVIGSGPTGTYDFAGSIFLNDFSLKAFLQGPFTINAAGPIDGDTMTTALRYKNFIPLISPYNAAISVGSIPVDVTDWIQVQVVDPTNAATIYGETSAFIKKDGSIVNLTGTGPVSIPFNQAAGSIRLRHRNHLSVRTNSITFTGGLPNLFDFTGNGAGGANPLVFVAPNINISPSINLGLPQKEVETGKFGMWSGDVNGNGIVQYNLGGNDRLFIFNAIGGLNQNNTTPGYLKEDVNMNGITQYNLGGNDRLLIFNNIGNLNQNATVAAHN
jgi:hypothetical protein